MIKAGPHGTAFAYKLQSFPKHGIITATKAGFFLMINILFICHGNICRSPTAEFVMKHLVKQAGLENEFHIASAATHTDELGEPVYPPSRKKMAENGIDCSGKVARLMRPDDYEKYDLLIGMDDENQIFMHRMYSPDTENKLKNMMDYAGKIGASVADPWYTRDFELTWQDINAACRGLLEELTGTVTIDFSKACDRKALYAQLREKMDWQDWYGENLDALSDVLTGLPHKGSRFLFIMPKNGDCELFDYAEKIIAEFEEAGKTVVKA